MSPSVHPKVRLTTDFRGLDYVTETARFGNLTVKRHFPVDYGHALPLISYLCSLFLVLTKHLNFQSKMETFVNYLICALMMLAEFFAILVVFICPFILQPTGEFLIITTISYGFLTYAVVTGFDGFQVEERLSRLTTTGNVLITILITCQIISTILICTKL